MRNVGEESNAIFDKLGLNSLSKKKKKRDKAFKPTSMSAGMAFGLSLKNLVSKKAARCLRLCRRNRHYRSCARAFHLQRL